MRLFFDSSKASAVRGKPVFEKNCAICHTLAGQGYGTWARRWTALACAAQHGCVKTAPSSRNVAAEFKQTTFVLGDGNVVAGIPRRQEGQTVVIADSTGKEVSIQKSNITRQVESKSRLMPSNVSEDHHPR